MIKAIGYIRVSTLEQANEGISLLAQANKIRAYAELHDELELIEVIEDAGISGTTMKRDGLQKVIELIESQEVDALIVYKLDRLSRKVVDTLNIIERVEDAGAIFHSIREKVDTQSAIGKFFLTITAAFAQMERDVISERTKEALAYKSSQGEYLGAVPYGFTLKGSGLTKAEDEARVIGTIVLKRQEGLTLRAIAQYLNDSGIKTKRNGRWYATTVKNVLDRVLA